MHEQNMNKEKLKKMYLVFQIKKFLFQLQVMSKFSNQSWGGRLATLWPSSSGKLLGHQLVSISVRVSEAEVPTPGLTNAYHWSFLSGLSGEILIKFLQELHSEMVIKAITLI